jgi:hypothetical protein
MKKIYTLIAAVLFTAITFAQDAWKTIGLMDKVSVSMPSTVKEEERGGRKAQSAKLADSSSFVASAIDFAGFGLTEDVIASMSGSDEFRDQIKGGMLGSMPGANVLSEKTITYQEKYTCYEFEIETEEKGKKVKRFARLVFYKSFGISINYSAGMNGVNAADKDKFFNSLKIEG